MSRVCSMLRSSFSSLQKFKKNSPKLNAFTRVRILAKSEKVRTFASL